MCRRSKAGRAGNLRRTLWLWLFATALTAPIAADALADDISDYLEQHGLKQLLATYLEQQIDVLKPEERGDLVIRLSTLYAELLESVSDPTSRADLEQRSRKLLDKAPASGGVELRLALLRATYRNAEKAAESRRLRMASDEDVEAAKKSLADIIPQIANLRQRLKREAEVTDRRITRSSGTQSLQLTEAGERAQALVAQCTFLHAWALYYQSWLNDRPDEARLAEPLFGELLASESPYPQPSDVSVDLRATEAVARAVLGMALCKSLTASSATAISWLNLLDHPSTFEALRLQAPVWKIAVYLEHREYQQVKDVLSGREAGDIPLPWLRLIAVYAIEDTQHSRLADELARMAVLAIASKGELDQIMDLANRFGIDALGKSGFALQYVHGVMGYQKARATHGSEVPTLDEKVVSLYTSAQSQLEAALKEPDAANYPVPAAACSRLIAWCLYFRSHFLEAGAAFEKVAATMSGDDAAESLWMAIVSLDKAQQASRDPATDAAMAELSERFLNQFPSSEHAATLRMRRAVASKEVSNEAVDELLAIPADSAVYDAAQRRAADMLYQLFRSAAARDKIYVANRFLAVAVPLLGPAARAQDLADSTGAASAGSSTSAGADRFIVRCRQVLEAALSDGVDRPDAARTAFEALDELRNIDGVDLQAVRDELDCRRVQERLASRDAQGAADVANDLWERDNTSIWTRLANRAMFRFAYQGWKSDESSPEAKRAGMDLVIRFGGRVLHEFAEADDGLNLPGSLGYHVAVAEATFESWQLTGDAEAGKKAHFLYQKLVQAKPRNAAFLRSAAILSEQFGEPAKALECWRTLLAGLEDATDGWYEAKFHVIKLLAGLDPQRAREVMDQHKQLNPAYGPDPWGGRLKGLDAEIPSAKRE